LKVVLKYITNEADMRTNTEKTCGKPTGLAETLFSDYRRRILALLLLRPDEHYHVREISRLTGVPAGSLHRELRLLADVGLLSRHSAGNQVRYQANRDCPIFHELAGIFRKTSGLSDIIRAALQPLSPAIKAAFIFGSVAKGEEKATSDVDVCVIGTASFTDVVVALADMNRRIGREINPVVIPYNQFAAKLAAGEQFTTRIMNEPKLFLVGDEHDLGKSA
jgi:predicted nucleotidyltransferase